MQYTERQLNTDKQVTEQLECVYTNDEATYCTGNLLYDLYRTFYMGKNGPPAASKSKPSAAMARWQDNAPAHGCNVFKVPNVSHKWPYMARKSSAPQKCRGIFLGLLGQISVRVSLNMNLGRPIYDVVSRLLL